MSIHTSERLRNTAAADLAWLLKAARAYVAQPERCVCCDCGRVFTRASRTSDRRCLACAAVLTPKPTARP